MLQSIINWISSFATILDEQTRQIEKDTYYDISNKK